MKRPPTDTKRPAPQGKVVEYTKAEKEAFHHVKQDGPMNKRTMAHDKKMKHIGNTSSSGHPKTGGKKVK